MKVTIKPSFWLLAITLGLFAEASIQSILSFALILFFVFFVHEAGHVLVARWFRCSSAVEISCTGGETIPFGRMLSMWQQVLVLIAGPVSSFLLSIVCQVTFLYVTLPPLVSGLIRILGGYSFIWGFFHILPLYPLDMGKIVYFMLQKKMPTFSDRLVAILGILLSLAFSLIFAAYGGFPFALYMFWILAINWNLFKESSKKVGVMKKDIVLNGVQRAWDEGKKEEVLQELRGLIATNKDQKMRQYAVSRLSSYLMELSRIDEAYDLLSSVKDPLLPSSLENLQLAAYRTAHYEEALKAAHAAFRHQQKPSIAILASLIAARLNLADEALGWIETAHKLGGDPQEIMAAKEFEQFMKK